LAAFKVAARIGLELLLERKMAKFRLPPVIADLVLARNCVRDHYDVPGLAFTLDGKLVGDIGEAVAAEMFGLTLSPGGGTGIDGRSAGPVFRQVDTRAEHLIFIDFNFAELEGEIVFNGPEHIALRNMPLSWKDQRSVTKVQIRLLNAEVSPEDRLPVINPNPRGEGINSN
jgi:hypothetical protein